MARQGRAPLAILTYHFGVVRNKQIADEILGLPYSVGVKPIANKYSISAKFNIFLCPRILSMEVQERSYKRTGSVSAGLTVS